MRASGTNENRVQSTRRAANKRSVRLVIVQGHVFPSGGVEVEVEAKENTDVSTIWSHSLRNGSVFSNVQQYARETDVAGHEGWFLGFECDADMPLDIPVFPRCKNQM